MKNNSVNSVNNLKKKQQIYKSASLTFMNNQNYLLCEEYRYKEKKALIHTIGGKVETFDKDLLHTAIREFIEETNSEAHPNINCDLVEKNNLIEKLLLIIKDFTEYKDLCINKELGYYHRYYLVKLNEKLSIEFINSILNLPLFFNSIYKTEVDLLLWINFQNNNQNNQNNQNNIIIDKKFSWLTKMFIKKIGKCS